MAMIAAILIGDLFAAGEVAFIMEIGALLEDMTTERAKKGLKKLISLAPEKARLMKNGSESSIAIEKGLMVAWCMTDGIMIGSEQTASFVELKEVHTAWMYCGFKSEEDTGGF